MLLIMMKVSSAKEASGKLLVRYLLENGILVSDFFGTSCFTGVCTYYYRRTGGK